MDPITPLLFLWNRLRSALRVAWERYDAWRVRYGQDDWENDENFR